MYIISKHKDYYDYQAQIYGVDKKVVYHRHPTQEELTYGTYVAERVITRNNKVSRYYFSFDYIWVSDKKFPIVILNTLENDSEYIYYTHEKLVLDWPEMKTKKSRWVQRDSFEEHFKTKSSTGKLNSRYKSPQLLVHRNIVYKDILLKDYGFQHIMPPEQAYQTISMFMAAQPDASQTIPTDMHRFEAKGFDKRTSFRNM